MCVATGWPTGTVNSVLLAAGPSFARTVFAGWLMWTPHPTPRPAGQGLAHPCSRGSHMCTHPARMKVQAGGGPGTTCPCPYLDVFLECFLFVFLPVLKTTAYKASATLNYPSAKVHDSSGPWKGTWACCF